MSNDITASYLRDKLNDVMDLVIGGEMKVNEARAVNDIAKTIVDTAKTEVAAAKVYADAAPIIEKSGFIEQPKSLEVS